MHGCYGARHVLMVRTRHIYDSGHPLHLILFLPTRPWPGLIRAASDIQTRLRYIFQGKHG